MKKLIILSFSLLIASCNSVNNTTVSNPAGNTNPNTNNSTDFNSNPKEIIYYSSEISNNKINIAEYNGKLKKSIDTKNIIITAFDTTQDGKTIVFTGVENNTSNLYIVNSDGTNLRNVTNFEKNTKTNFPLISPDGKTIAFIKEIDLKSDIYTMDITGNNIKNITNDSIIKNYPNWSIDSNVIFYTQFGNIAQIVSVNKDGIKNNILNPNFDNYNSKVSPDGKKIVYISKRNNKWNLYISDINGENEKKVTDGNEDIMPSWSYDSQKIVYVSKIFNEQNEAFTNKIISVNTDGTQSKIISENPDDELAVWSKDSNTIYFRSGRNSNYDIYLMNNEGKNQTNITNTKNYDESNVKLIY